MLDIKKKEERERIVESIAISIYRNASILVTVILAILANWQFVLSPLSSIFMIFYIPISNMAIFEFSSQV